MNFNKFLKQVCVYWPLQGIESNGSDYDSEGQPLYSVPCELACRWEDKAEKYINAQGEETVSSSVVLLNEDVQLSGVLMLGTLDDITDENEPLQNDNAFEIKSVGKMPDIKAKNFLRTVYL